MQRWALKEESDYLRHVFTASTTLLDKFSVEPTARDAFAQNEIALEVKRSTKHACAVADPLRYHSDLPPLFKRTGTLRPVHVVYELK